MAITSLVFCLVKLLLGNHLAHISITTSTVFCVVKVINPALLNVVFTTIAVKPDTYRKLAEIKERFKLRSYDDVVKILLNCYIKSAEATA